MMDRIKIKFATPNSHIQAKHNVNPNGLSSIAYNNTSQTAAHNIAHNVAHNSADNCAHNRAHNSDHPGEKRALGTFNATWAAEKKSATTTNIPSAQMGNPITSNYTNTPQIIWGDVAS